MYFERVDFDPQPSQWGIEDLASSGCGSRCARPQRQCHNDILARTRPLRLIGCLSESWSGCGLGLASPLDLVRNPFTCVAQCLTRVCRLRRPQRLERLAIVIDPLGTGYRWLGPAQTVMHILILSHCWDEKIFGLGLGAIRIRGDGCD